jgi:hypothetical protein
MTTMNEQQFLLIKFSGKLEWMKSEWNIWKSDWTLGTIWLVLCNLECKFTILRFPGFCAKIASDHNVIVRSCFMRPINSRGGISSLQIWFQQKLVRVKILILILFILPITNKILILV